MTCQGRHRHGWRRSVVGLALATLPLAAAPAHADVTRTGILRELHEDLTGQAERDFWALDTSPGLVRLSVKGDAPERLEGRRVRARGGLRRGKLVVRASALRAVDRGRSSARAAATPGPFPTATILIHLTDPSENQPTSPYQPGDVRTKIYGDAAADPYSVKKYYLAQTYGQFDIVGARDPANGDIFGPYDVPDPFPGQGCQFAYWANSAAQLAEPDGFDFRAYKAVIYIFVTNRCGFAGVGGGGPQVYINSMNKYTIAHELGHTFGNGHASTLRCWNGGAVAIYSATCDPWEEYGDPFDPMGGGGTIVQGAGEAIPHEMEPWRKIKIGAMPASDGPLANTPGNYRITPIERSAGTRMLRLPTGRGDRKFFDLSFRQPLGLFDSTWSDSQAGNPRAFDGVLVTLDDGVNNGENSMLLDMTPETAGGSIDPYTHLVTNGFQDAPLQVGRTFTDGVSGLSLTVNAVGPDGADVTVAYGQGSLDVATPTIPGQPTATVAGSVVSLNWPPSSDAYGVTRYLVSRNGTGLPDVSGTATSDTPGTGTFSYSVRAADAAGNVSPPSSPASVTIPGARPPGPPIVPALTLTKLTASKDGKKGSFTLNHPARVTLAFARKTPGRLKGKSCVAPSKAPKGKTCTRRTTVKTQSVAGKAGANSVSFKVAAGSYVVTASAKDAAGKTAKATAKLTVPKPKKKK